MRFVTISASRAGALWAAVVLAVVAVASGIVALAHQPFPEGSLGAQDFTTAFAATAVWGFAFGALALFYLVAVLERPPANALGPDPEVLLIGRVGGILTGLGLGLGWGLLPALAVSPAWGSTLLVATLVGLILFPSIGLGLATWSYRLEVDEFEGEESRDLSPSRIVPSTAHDARQRVATETTRGGPPGVTNRRP